MTRMHRPRGDDSTATWVLALTAMASLMVALDATALTTALSAIRLDLSTSIAELEWTMNAYVLSFAVLLMTGAALGDRFGRRRMFIAGLALFSAASGGCALAPDIGTLIAARAIQGAGAALVAPLALTLLSTAFTPERRPRALGIFSAVTGLAVLGGPVLGGAITEGIAWSWIFWLNVPIGLVTIVLVRARVPERHGPRRSLDISGAALAAGATFGIVWGLVRGNAAGWGSFEVTGSLVAGSVLLAVFVTWERRARATMLPTALFGSRRFAAGNAATFLLSACLFGSVYFMAQFLQTAQHHGPLGAGVRLLPWTATLFLVAPLAGARIHRLGERPFICGGLLLQAAGIGWIALIAGPQLPYLELIPPLILAGAGISMAIPAAQSAVVSSVSSQQIGVASGTFNTLRQLGGAFGVAIAVAAFAATGSYASPAAFSSGFTPALAACAALSLAGSIAGLALPRRRHTAAAGAVVPNPALEGGA